MRLIGVYSYISTDKAGREIRINVLREILNELNNKTNEN
jgi:hypothetical protein